MTPIQEKLTDPLNPDDLNELVLEAAARITDDELSPDDEVTPDIIVRGETIEAGGHRVEVLPAKNEETTIAEQLVDAGNDEAGLEQRLASAKAQQTKT